MVSASVTLRTLSLGASDTTTGWYAKTYADTTIDMVILPKGASMRGLPTGYYSRYDSTGFTADPIAEDDEITDSASNRFKVTEVQKWFWLDSFSHYTCNLVPLQGMPIVRPTTFGTGITVKDARENTMTYLETYITANVLHKDDGASHAVILHQYANPDYSLKRVFNTKAVDVIYSVGAPESRVDRVGYTGQIKSYIESVPITINTVDKTGITGNNLLWQATWFLRDTVEHYPPTRSTSYATGYTSYRSLNRVRDANQEMGGYTMYGVEYSLSYMRDLT